jgi:hypothetical protein
LAIALTTLALAWAGCSSGSSGKNDPDGGGGHGGKTTGTAGSAGAVAGSGGTASSAGAGGGGTAGAQAGAGGTDARAGAGGGDPDGGGDTPQDVPSAGDAPGDAHDGAAGSAEDAPLEATSEAGGDAPSDGAVPAAIVVDLPSFSVAATSESTRCIVLDLGNAGPIHVGEIKATLGAVVYELRIGALATGAAQATFTPCTPFADTSDANVKPIFFARNRSEALSFPVGVGYTLAAHQLLRFEIHGSNPSGTAADTAVTATLTPVPAATFQHEAGLVFVEAAGFTIPAHGTNVDSGRVYVPVGAALGAASITRVMGYTHHLGVDVSISTATGAGDLAPLSISSVVYDASSPSVVNESTPVTLSASGGIDVECFWSNPNGQTSVARGPSVDDERCAAVLSYYPAAPAQLCLHTPFGGGVDFCCPGGVGCN